jgi:hypothetical protein
MKNVTDIIAIIDRSGSMASIQSDMEGGFNAFVAKQRETPGACALNLYQFDDQYEVVYEDRPIATAPTFRLEPRGATALLDAIGRTVTRRGQHYAKLPEAERPEKVVVVVVTDGHENASEEYTQEAVRALVTQQQDVYKWEFVFLGANMDAISVGIGMGFSPSKSMTYRPDSAGVAYSCMALSQLVADYKRKDLGEGMDDFTDFDRKEAGGKK